MSRGGSAQARRPGGSLGPRRRAALAGKARRGGPRDSRGDPSSSPTTAGFHRHLGLVSCSDQLKFDESLPEFREAIRLEPDKFPAVPRVCDQPSAGRRNTPRHWPSSAKAQALSARSLADYYHPPEWFAKIESLAALAERLPAILKGEDRPKTSPSGWTWPRCATTSKLYAAALRFRAEALEEDPKLGDNRRAQHRYNAACSALLVAAGRGKDATPLDDAARSDLRRRALRGSGPSWPHGPRSSKPDSAAGREGHVGHPMVDPRYRLGHRPRRRRPREAARSGAKGMAVLLE